MYSAKYHLRELDYLSVIQLNILLIKTSAVHGGVCGESFFRMSLGNITHRRK